MTARAAARRAAPAVAAAAAVAVLLANVRSRPPAISVPPEEASAPPASAPQAPTRRVSTRKATRKGPVRSATETRTTPFSVISVKATLTGGRLTRVETVDLTGDGARTQAINARAEPILRAEAIKAGSGDIDVVTGATYTSRSYRNALQAAIDRARG
jgi:uncharacterized protein with FMN-binding domain